MRLPCAWRSVQPATASSDWSSGKASPLPALDWASVWLAPTFSDAPCAACCSVWAQWISPPSEWSGSSCWLLRYWPATCPLEEQHPLSLCNSSGWSEGHLEEG